MVDRDGEVNMGSGSPKTPPLVSVIMPTYNHSEFITEAIESVCKQTLKELELIVVDDGSTDHTPEILAEISDERVRSVRTTNRGMCAARNVGLQNAEGKYLAFLDSDDLYHPDKLRLQVDLLERYPDITIYFHDFDRFSSDEGLYEHTHFHFVPEVRRMPSRPLHEIPGTYVLEGDAFHLFAPFQMLVAWLQTLMVRREVVEHFGFDEALSISGDLAYALRCYQRGRAAYIDRCLASLRRHGRNSFSDPFDIILPKIEALSIIEREIEDPQYKAIIKRRLGDEWRSYGYHGWFQADRRKAIRGYARSLSFPGRRIKSLVHLSLALLCPSVSLFGKILARRGGEAL